MDEEDNTDDDSPDWWVYAAVVIGVIGVVLAIVFGIKLRNRPPADGPPSV